jgi:hypothetical protein
MLLLVSSDLCTILYIVLMEGNSLYVVYVE